MVASGTQDAAAGGLQDCWAGNLGLAGGWWAAFFL